VDQAQANLPQGRTETLAYDKAADDEKVHQRLHGRSIKPVIQNRALWPKDGEQEKVLPGGRYPLHLVHDEAGTVPCYDTVSEPPVRHRMAYLGYEKDRDCVKYRCPARHEGWDCPSDEKCNAGLAAGLSARIPCELDLGRFPPIPRATKEFERRYRGRTAAERVNARLKIFWGADDRNVTGARRPLPAGGLLLHALEDEEAGLFGLFELGRPLPTRLREAAVEQAPLEPIDPLLRLALDRQVDVRGPLARVERERPPGQPLAPDAEREPVPGEGVRRRLALVRDHDLVPALSPLHRPGPLELLPLPLGVAPAAPPADASATPSSASPASLVLMTAS
jgi:hypothetical protein